VHLTRTQPAASEIRIPSRRFAAPRHLDHARPTIGRRSTIEVQRLPEPIRGLRGLTELNDEVRMGHQVQPVSRIAGPTAAPVDTLSTPKRPLSTHQPHAPLAVDPTIGQRPPALPGSSAEAPRATRQHPPLVATSQADSGPMVTLDITRPSSEGSGLPHAADAAASARAAAVLAAFPATAREMESAIQSAKTRPVSTEEAASLVNELRRYGPLAHQSPDVHAAESNRELMGGITDAQTMRWYAAQGLNEHDVAALRNAAFNSGLPNPSGTFLMNALQFIAAPAVTAATGSPWLGAGLGMAIAGASPLANAIQQSGVVTLCEHIRERQGPSVTAQKSSINDKQWLPQTAAEVSTRAEALVRKGDQFEATLDRLLGQHPDIAGGREQQLQALLPRLGGDQKTTLLAHATELHDAEQSLHALQKELLMTQGAHKRQLVGNTHQILPRALRGPAAAMVGLASGAPTGAAAAAMAVGRVAQLTPLQAAGVQAAASLFLTAGQHVASAYDERGKQDYNNQLNLMYADICTEAGNKNWADGKPLVASDISEQKLRSFISAPAQTLAKRLETNISGRITGLEEQARTLEQVVAQQRAAAGPGWNEDPLRRQPVAPSPEGMADPLRGAAGAAATEDPLRRQPIAPAPAWSADPVRQHSTEELALDATNALLAELRHDKAHLKEGTVSQLKPDGVAAGLLAGSLDRFASSFLKEDLIAKYKKPGEISSQTAQRIGQVFHMLAVGSGAAAVVGKVGAAAFGGASQTPTAAVLGLAGVSATIGAIGAASQSTAINIKNQRRESGGETTIGTQITRGVMALPIEATAQQSANAANRETSGAMERIQANADLAKTVRQQLAATDEHA
jgi:hypothetical protein